MSKIVITLALLGSAVATTGSAVAGATAASPAKDAPLARSGAAAKQVSLQFDRLTGPNGRYSAEMITPLALTGRPA